MKQNFRCIYNNLHNIRAISCCDQDVEVEKNVQEIHKIGFTSTGVQVSELKQLKSEQSVKDDAEEEDDEDVDDFGDSISDVAKSSSDLNKKQQLLLKL